jgi:hypothetical protein
MPKEHPLPLTHAEATELAEELEKAVARVRMDFIRSRRPDLDDHATTVIYREIALALGRCCVRYGFDILPEATASHIDRLEVAIAEANAAQERYRVAHVMPPTRFPEASHQGNGKIEPIPLHTAARFGGSHHEGCSCERCRGE